MIGLVPERTGHQQPKSMLQRGQSIRVIGGEGAPVASPKLGQIALILACGGEYAGEKPFLDTVDGDQKRAFAFGFNDDVKFSIQGESISLKDLLERFSDAEWCEANPEHPISYMHAFWAQILDLRQQLKAMKPLMKLQRTEDDGEESHTYTALISQDASPEDKAKMMALFEEGR